MFRDLKEYQEIAKIYAEKVSKPAEVESNELVENQENRKKLQLQRQKQNAGRVEKQFDFLKAKPRNLKPGQTSVRQSGVNDPRRKKNKVEIKPVETKTVETKPVETKPIETKSVETKPVETKPVETKPLTTKQKFDSKFIKKDKGSGFVKRGTPMAQRAEKKEAAKLKAQELARQRIKAKKEGTYQKPKTAQELAKERIAAKNKTVEKPIEKKTVEKKQETTTNTTPETSNTTKKKLPPSADIKPSGIFKDIGKSKSNDDGSKKNVEKKQTSNSSALNVSSTKTNNKKTKSKFEQNPRVKEFRKDVQDLKTQAEYGSTTTIQTQDGKEYKPGDPGYKDQLNKARETVKKSMQKNSYEPDAYDLVLEYLLSTGQAATIEEANYVMIEMDGVTINSIVKEFTE